MWAEYLKVSKIEDRGYSAWAFGDSPDELAALVNSGVKRATSSSYDMYMLNDEPLPKAGEYSVILNADGEALCIIRTVRVEVVRYCDVTAAFAAAEGEGDKSLSYWRQVHERFFGMELNEAGLQFSPETKVVCELFELVYKT